MFYIIIVITISTIVYYYYNKCNKYNYFYDKKLKVYYPINNSYISLVNSPCSSETSASSTQSHSSLSFNYLLNSFEE